MNKKLKIFISQPMSGKASEEILKEREEIIDLIKNNFYDEEFEIIDSFFENTTHDDNPLFWLGKSLESLSEADICVFSKNWESSKGCRIEHVCCIEYGIEMRYC